MTIHFRLIVRTMLLFAMPLVLSSPSKAQNYFEPARGTELRADLMDALRPHVEWELGAPVEFVVHELRVSGDVAFAIVTAQRPGGGAIDLRFTPMVVRDGIPLGMIDGTRTEALYVRSGRQWVAVHHAIGTTDVWYAYPPLCPIWGVVLPEYCL
jgi:hypothetical protein